MKNHLQFTIAIIISFSLFTFNSYAQNVMTSSSQEKRPLETPKNAFHLDLGTVFTAFATNINYEFHLTSTASRTFQFSGRMGLGYIYAAGIFCGGASGLFGSTGINMLVGSGSHHLDVNAGGQFRILSDGNDIEGFFRCSSELKSFIPLVEIGYRYQKPTGGFLFRAHIGSTGIALGFGNSW